MTDIQPPITPTPPTPYGLCDFVGAEARTVLEIGAHDGKDTRRLLKAFPQANLYAFEPDPRSAAKFRQRGEHPRLRFHETAVGAEDGRATFFASGGAPPEGTAMQAMLVTFEKTIDVSVVRLDTWTQAEDIGDIDLIWADVQGAEADLVRGGRETLKRTRWFYTEYSNDEWYEGQPTLSQLLAMLPGYSVHVRYPMDVLLRNAAFDDALAVRRRFGAAL